MTQPSPIPELTQERAPTARQRAHGVLCDRRWSIGSFAGWDAALIDIERAIEDAERPLVERAEAAERRAVEAEAHLAKLIRAAGDVLYYGTDHNPSYLALAAAVRQHDAPLQASADQRANLLKDETP
jgi:hypothetical protein